MLYIFAIAHGVSSAFISLNVAKQSDSFRLFWLSLQNSSDCFSDHEVNSTQVARTHNLHTVFPSPQQKKSP